jgi:hypothetical protein
MFHKTRIRSLVTMSALTGAMVLGGAGLAGANAGTTEKEAADAAELVSTTEGHEDNAEESDEDAAALAVECLVDEAVVTVTGKYDLSNIYLYDTSDGVRGDGGDDTIASYEGGELPESEELDDGSLEFRVPVEDGTVSVSAKAGELETYEDCAPDAGLISLEDDETTTAKDDALVSDDAATDDETTTTDDEAYRNHGQAVSAAAHACQEDHTGYDNRGQCVSEVARSNAGKQAEEEAPEQEAFQQEAPQHVEAEQHEAGEPVADEHDADEPEDEAEAETETETDENDDVGAQDVDTDDDGDGDDHKGKGHNPRA